MARGERPAVGPAFRGISDPDPEGEDGDQEGQREGEEDQINRRDAVADKGFCRYFQRSYGIAPTTGGEFYGRVEHGRHLVFWGSIDGE